ncbi:hypothetical protein Q7506_05605 [Glaesserella parasuis]|uniref:hypothetical protein n=1 Tax=Glaesserella parasuis TaxID=738 RepID=UPI00094FCD72|nr:hypothetical protein [Glaesserella parasuis]MDG6231822.1 hypothetical protein [Glaesserella parasuis]MDO9767385.1 hypothetical protein [Glaesserella parasuis]MWQ15146.1 hypothetical protein [Glaesserella parasuis]
MGEKAESPVDAGQVNRTDDYATLICAGLFLDIAEQEGLAIARAELEVALARCKLRELRNTQSTISNTSR